MAEARLEDRANSAALTSAGPEQVTIAERFVKASRLPYNLTCVIYALVFVEIPIIVARYSVDRTAWGRQEVLYLIVVFLMSVYFPLSVRFVRSRVLEAEPKLTPLLREGEADYHQAFGRAVSYRGQTLAILAIVLMAIYVVVQTNSLFNRIIIAVCAAYIAVMLGSLIAFNLGCIIGLYRLGRGPLRFKAFREDPKLGTTPIGSISLSLAGAYFAGVIILILFSVASPNELYKSPYLFGIYAVLILVGLGMFFLPLFRVHFRMAEEKTRQDALIQGNFDCLSHDLKASPGGDPLVNIQKLLSLDMADRKLQAISSWPFDTTLMGKLLIILLSVIAALIARALATILGWWTPV